MEVDLSVGFGAAGLLLRCSPRLHFLSPCRSWYSSLMSSYAVNQSFDALHPFVGANTPLTQSSFTYLSLTLVFGSILLHRQQKLLVPWYWYLLLGLVDVQGNYLVVKAFQYSSITSVTLLDCWTIPWVIILTWLVLGTRYSPWQLLGAAICVVGLGLVLLLDSDASDAGGKRPILGDALVVVGTLCYAFSNVGEEYCIKKKDLVEVLAMMGLFGFLISICEISVFERKDLELVKWSPQTVSLFVGFAVAQFLFYSIFPFVMKMSGSTLFNLSLLTSDIWAVAIRFFFYHQQINWLYYFALATVAMGLVIYSLNENVSSSETNNEESHTMKYQRLDQEGSTGNVVSVA